MPVCSQDTRTQAVRQVRTVARVAPDGRPRQPFGPDAVSMAAACRDGGVAALEPEPAQRPRVETSVAVSEGLLAFLDAAKTHVDPGRVRRARIAGAGVRKSPPFRPSLAPLQPTSTSSLR